MLEQLPPDAQVGVLVLNGRQRMGEWIIPLGPLQPERLEQAIRRIQASGGTPLGQFMKVAADALLKLRAQQRYGNYRLLIVTDGEAGDRQLVEGYLPQIQARGITVDVIGVDMQRDHSLKNQVTSYRRADDPRSLQQAIQESLAESSLDSQDADEQSDFELLAALPDEIALASIQQLCEANNEPIGSGDGPQWNEPSGDQAFGPPAGGQRRPPGRKREGPGRLLSLVFVVFVLTIVLRMVMRMFRSR